MNKKNVGAVIFLVFALVFLWYTLFYSRDNKNKFIKKETSSTSPAISTPISSIEISKEGVNEGLFLYPVNAVLPETPPGVQYLGDLSYDPFKVPLQYLINSGKGAQVVELKLSAIITVGNRKIAIINGKRYKEGDMLGPVMIKKIEGNRVYLQTPMGEDFLQLYTKKSYMKIDFSSPGSKEGGKK